MAHGSAIELSTEEKRETFCRGKAGLAFTRNRDAR
jgi:hypothetical protein